MARAEMQHLLRFMTDIQKGVSGVARLQLYKGSCVVTGRKARNSLYNPEYSTFEADRVYNQADAEKAWGKMLAMFKKADIINARLMVSNKSTKCPLR